MNASLDTDITIHLYQAGKKDLLFSFFEDLYIFEYILEEELRNKNRVVYEEVLADINKGKVNLCTRKSLSQLGVLGLFNQYCEDTEYLFDSGEMHAVALARAMGLAALVTDDSKQFGPHDTLVRELIPDVIPFAFYEILYIEYISSKLTVERLYHEFNAISSRLEHPMDFSAKLRKTLRRFGRYGTERDRKWIETYCQERGIQYQTKVQQLTDFLDR